MKFRPRSSFPVSQADFDELRALEDKVLNSNPNSNPNTNPNLGPGLEGR